jgi:hypothetical protein
MLFIASTSPISPISRSFGVAGSHVLWYPDVNLSPTEDSESLHRLLQLIPPEASVLTQNHIFPHVSARLNAYVIPALGRFENDTQYVVDLINKSDYILIDMYGWDVMTAKIFEEIAKNGSHGVYALGSKSLLFKRGYQDSPMFAHYTEQRFFNAYNGLRSLSGQVLLDAYSKSGMPILCPKEFVGVGVRGPYAYLLPGTYNITFMTKVEDNSSRSIATFGISYTKDQFVLVSTREVNGLELKPNKWFNTTFTVTFAEITPNIEFLTWVTGATNLYEDGVVVTRVSDGP